MIEPDPVVRELSKSLVTEVGQPKLLGYDGMYETMALMVRDF